jgi:hypothetical protein
MACEYLANNEQSVALNAPVLFTASIPCTKGYVYFEDETGVLILRGITNNQCFATYQVTFNGNIALPADATDVVPVAIALSVNGEPRLTSRAIYTPQAVDEYGNVTSTAIIKVPKGCCFTLSVESVSATTDATVTPAPLINVQNANLTVSRIA